MLRVTPGNRRNGCAEGAGPYLLTKREKGVESDTGIPSSGISIPGFDGLITFGHHHAMADQAGARVTASLQQEPNLSPGQDVPVVADAPALQEPAGLRNLLDGGAVVPAVPPVGVPSQNYCSHHSPVPAHAGPRPLSLNAGTWKGSRPASWSWPVFRVPGAP